MKNLLLIISVFVIIINVHTNVYATTYEEEETFIGVYEPNTVPAPLPKEENDKFVQFSNNQDANIDEILNDPNSSEIDLLRAILVCVKDIDLYVQFLVTIGFSIGLIYFVILKPIRFFLY